MKKMNCNLTEKKDSILASHRLTSETLDNDDKRTLTSFFAIHLLLFFFLQRPTKERWKCLRDRHIVEFSKYSDHAAFTMAS